MCSRTVAASVVLGLMYAAHAPGQTGGTNLALEARPVSAGAVELRWNGPVDAMIERKPKGGAFEEVTRTAATAGTLGNVPMRSYFDRGLAADTEYTYRFAIPNGWHYDFGPKGQPAAQDHVRVSGEDAYSDTTGFGFEKPGKAEAKGHDPRNRDNSYALSSVFIQRAPNGTYLVSAGGFSGEFAINGVQVKAEGKPRSIQRLQDFEVVVTDGKLTVDAKGAFRYLNIVPKAEPKIALATATGKTFSLNHMVKIMNDVKQPQADRLAALYSLGDMRAAASKAAPAIAEVLLATEKDKGPMHWLAVWSLWKIGTEHVGERGQRAAAEKILARFTTYNKALLPAPARAVIQEVGERPLFGQYQMGLTCGVGEKLPPRLSDEAFFGRWNTASNAWVVKPILQYDFSTNLNATREAARRGDWESAKRELLAYYRARKDIARPEAGPPGETLAGEAALRGCRDAVIKGAFTVRGDWQWYTIALPSNSMESVYLISDWERAGLVGIRSRENKGFAPRLEIVTDKTKHVLEAEGDTTVRAGAYAGINYGTNDMLMVQEGPVPQGPVPSSDETMRAYLYFNLPASISTGAETVQSQTLHLYAKTLGARKEVSLAVFGKLLPSMLQGRENSLTWGNHTTPYHVYNDIDFDWFRPPGAERQAKYWYPRGAFSHGAAMYAATSNEQHAYNGLFSALDFCTKQRPDHHFKIDTGWRLRSSHQMLLALESEFMTPDVWTSLLKAFYEHARIMSGEPGGPGNASRTIQFGWLLCNTYYPEISQPGWWKLNTERQASNVRGSLGPDGSYCEATTGYVRGTMVAMQESIDLVKRARGILLPSAEPYGQLAEYYMNMTTPAGTLYNWGPGGRLNVRSYVLEAGETLENPYLIYFGSKGERGSKPLYDSKLYPFGKTFTMRTSWTDENGLGAFFNARVGGGHSCPDDLNLDIFAYGRYLLADPGPGSYNSTDPASAWQSGTTIAHNTIVIDGNNQSRNGKSDIWAVANPVFDYVGAWVESYGEGVRVYRRVLFVRPSYWIVSDYIRAAPGAHTYDQAWHPDLDSNPETDVVTQRVQTHFAGTANVQLVTADPAEARANILDGWMEGRKAKYVTFRKSGVTGDTTFDTVIYPTKAGESTAVTVERLTVKGPGGEMAKTNATALKIEIGKGRTGYYCHSYLEKPEPVEFGGFTFDGEMAYVEQDAKGAVTYAALRKGRSLQQGGKKLVQANAPLETLGVRAEGDTFRIEGPVKTLDVAVRAPAGIKKTLLNGEEVPFSMEDSALRVLRSGGITGFDFDGAAVKGLALDPGARTILVLVDRGTRLDSLKPRLAVAEGYEVAGGTATDFTKPVQFSVKAGSGADPVIWTVMVHPLNRAAIPAFDVSATGCKAPVGRNTDRLYKSLTGWNAQGDWLEWKIDVPATGNYVPAFMYASAHGSPLRDLAVDGQVKAQELRFVGTGDWGAKETAWTDMVFPLETGIRLEKGTHTIRMTNLNGEGMNLGWIALIPVEELPLALDSKVKGHMEPSYLRAMEREFKVRNRE